jgi:hypothetical protein
MRRLPPCRSFLGGAAIAVSGGAAVVAITACGSSSKATLTTRDTGATSAQNSRTGARVLPPVRTELAAAASYLGVSVAQLHRELRGGKSLVAVARKTRGKSEAGLIAAIEHQGVEKTSKSLKRRLRAEVRTPGQSLLPLLSLREDARDYLDLTVPQLREHEGRGKSLAQIARAIPGKSEAAMIDAIFDARERQLEAAVKAGRLRADVEQLSLSHLRQRIQTYVQFVPASGSS